MIVHDHAASRLYESGRENVLACPSLMCRQAVFHTEYFFKLVPHAEERFASCIGIIRRHHAGEHLIAHRIYTGVGKHVHEDVAVVKLEGIESGFSHLLQSLFGRQQLKLLNDLYFVHLYRNRFVIIKLNCGHYSIPPCCFLKSQNKSSAAVCCGASLTMCVYHIIILLTAKQLPCRGSSNNILLRSCFSVSFDLDYC